MQYEAKEGRPQSGQQRRYVRRRRCQHLYQGPRSIQERFRCTNKVYIVENIDEVYLSLTS